MSPRRYAYWLVAPLLLFGCLEDSNNAANVAGGGIMMAAQEAGYNVAPAASMKSADSATMQPSNMVLDRSKLNGRRIAETHTMGIDIGDSALQARFQRDFKRCLELECEITNSFVNAKSDASLNLRIDPANLPTFLDFLATGPGEVKSHQVGAEDKSLDYIDTAAKLDNHLALRDRLRKMLESGQAKTVQETLEIERELTRVQGEIDAQTKQKLFLERVTDKATVNVSYRVPHPTLSVDYDSLRGSLREAWRGFIRNVAGMIQFTGSFIPWIPLMFLTLWVVMNLSRFAERRRERKAFSVALWRKKVAEATRKERDEP